MNCHTGFQVPTPSHEALVPITRQVQEAVYALNLIDGVVHLFVMHTTCGLTINENADPDVVGDLLGRLSESIPWKRTSDRHLEGNSAAHLKCSYLGTSLSIPVQKGQLILGTWQGVFLAEFDGPRTRTVQVTALHSAS